MTGKKQVFCEHVEGGLGIVVNPKHLGEIDKGKHFKDGSDVHLECQAECPPIPLWSIAPVRPPVKKKFPFQK